MIGRDAGTQSHDDALRFGRTVLAVSSRPILDHEVAGIVSPANRTGAMGVGIAGTIRSAGGFEIEREAMAKAPLALGTAIATSSGTLFTAGIQTIIHAVITDALGTPVTRPDVVRRATDNALQLADTLRLRTLALPALGGTMASDGLDAPGAFAIMIEEAAAYQRRFTSRIARIIFVCRDDREARAVRSLLREEHATWTTLQR